MSELESDPRHPAAPGVVRLPDKVLRSARVLVALTAPRFRDVEHFVVEVVRDVLDEVGLDGAAADGDRTPPRTPRRTTRRAGGRAPGVEDPVRAKAMHDRYLEGRTLQEVGDEFGITRERVRQVFVAAGYHSRRRGERRALRESEDDLRFEEVVAAYREIGDLDETAERVGMSVGRVRGVLARQNVDLRAYRRGRAGGWQQYGDDELLDCVRSAAADPNNLSGRGILTGQGYERVRRGRRLADGRPWPSAQSVAARFGSWRAALERLGLPSNPPSPVAGMRRYDEHDCIDAVRQVRGLLGRLPSSAEYEELAPALGGLPSLATVQHRVGSWQRALRLAGGQPGHGAGGAGSD